MIYLTKKNKTYLLSLLLIIKLLKQQEKEFNLENKLGQGGFGTT
jgi:hypothetical protein